MRKIFVSKIIVHNNILCEGDLTYVAIFPISLIMDLIFTNFSTGSGSEPCLLKESLNVRRIPE